MHFCMGSIGFSYIIALVAVITIGCSTKESNAHHSSIASQSMAEKQVTNEVAFTLDVTDSKSNNLEKIKVQVAGKGILNVTLGDSGYSVGYMRSYDSVYVLKGKVLVISGINHNISWGYDNDEYWFRVLDGKLVACAILQRSLAVLQYWSGTSIDRDPGLKIGEIQGGGYTSTMFVSNDLYRIDVRYTDTSYRITETGGEPVVRRARYTLLFDNDLGVYYTSIYKAGSLRPIEGDGRETIQEVHQPRLFDLGKHRFHAYYGYRWFDLSNSGTWVRDKSIKAIP